MDDACGDDFGRADDVMYYEKLRFSLNQIDKAGSCLIKDDIYNTINTVLLRNALEMLFNYRVAHSFPLNSLYVTLQRRAKKSINGHLPPND